MFFKQKLAERGEEQIKALSHFDSDAEEEEEENEKE